MQAIRMSAFGGPDVLRFVTLEDPKPEQGQVRVRLHAVGVNPAETYVRAGTYSSFRPQLPYVPGWDGAGVVEMVGQHVAGFHVGDRVFVATLLDRSSSGTYAEHVVCAAESVHPLPAALSFTQGAAVGVPFTTAYRALVQRALVSASEWVLIHGASGGVGTAAVQLARALGARVIGSAGTQAGRDLVSSLGAEHVLDHTAEGYLDQVAAITDGHGLDLVVEMLANVNLERDLGALATRGRIVVVGSRGSLPFTPRLTMVKEASLLGMTLWNTRPAEWDACTAGVAAGLDAGFLRPVVGREFPLAEAPRAHVEILAPGACGKMVLVV